MYIYKLVYDGAFFTLLIMGWILVLILFVLEQIKHIHISAISLQKSISLCKLYYNTNVSLQCINHYYLCCFLHIMVIN